MAGVFLAAVLAGSALVFDTASDSAFDAPKRLVTLFGIAAAALSAFGFAPWTNPFAGKSGSLWRGARLALLLAAGAAGLALLAAVASPRRALSLDAARALLLMLLLLPLGASRVWNGRRGLLVTAFLGAACVNALVSILQARGIYQPFPLITRGEREATGAFAGNVGYLALSLALAAVAALGIALASRKAAVRICAGATLLLCAGALLVNRNLTSFSTLLAGSAVLLFGWFGRRAAVPVAAAVLLFAAGVALYRPMRERAAGAVGSIREGDWDQLLSYRTAPWAAAIEMARDRPLTGYGPGTFEAEFVAHRLKAEISARRRLVNPLVTSTYSEAHCDYLQPFAEAGIPAGLLALGGAALLLAALARQTRRGDDSVRAELVILLAVLAAGATAALTWFPFQRPITSV
ncbi:MAG TPA: O-antigen ligase family protein, partial [Thermoanaerobaculia bacterium]